VTKPFPFEGRVRTKHSEAGIDELHGVVDTLITIPNQRLLALAGKGTAIRDAFKLADDVLQNAVRGISDLITIHGLINLDFADVRTVMNEAGVALMGTGVGHGDTRAVDAAQSAISSPLLEDLSIDGARGVLINITGGDDMTLFEVNEASMLVQEAAHEEANIIFGAVIDETMPEGELRVTVIATGLKDSRVRSPTPPRSTKTIVDEDFGHEQLEIENVTPIHNEPAQLEPVMSMDQVARQPDTEAPALPQRPIEQYDQTARGGPPQRPVKAPRAEEMARSGTGGFESPFDDELDTPAFLRRRGESDEDEDREIPAFLRRAQD
jgi:cell division protein FtsZ